MVRDVIKSNLPRCEKKMLLNEIRKLMPPDENRWNFRYVIWTLALVALSVPVTAAWQIYECTPSLAECKVQDMPQGGCSPSAQRPSAHSPPF